MNIKALITTLVLGSSSMASADSLSVRGSVTVSLGSTRPVYPSAADDCAPVAAVPYKPAPSRPVYQPVRPLPAPVWQAPYYRITNTSVGATNSVYNGSIAVSRARSFNGYGYVSNAWFDLTEATRIDSGRQFFTIGADKGLFQQLKLQALGNGRSKIDQVGIEFIDARGNKQTQKVKLDTWLDRSNSTITIDLDGGFRSINRIIVYGATDQGSAYKLLAK